MMKRIQIKKGEEKQEKNRTTAETESPLRLLEDILYKHIIQKKRRCTRLRTEQTHRKALNRNRNIAWIL
jgi:hypothetical protein